MFAVDVAVGSIAPDHLCGFDIEQVRCVQCFTRWEQLVFP